MVESHVVNIVARKNMVIIKAKIVTTKSAFRISVGTEFYQQPPTKLFSQVITAMTGSLVMYKS